MVERPSWVKDKKLDPKFETIQCKRFDDYKDFKTDDGCYILIKILFDTYEISIAVCNYDHTILKEFRGRRTQDIYYAIFDYEKKHKLNWFKRKDHIAYLGKELKKAEIALAMGNSSYYQE
ncbi:hypothetical protein CL615_04435 [archaeon]|jgi:hypothetical protein|nr:hypothetical protein [archaeon]MDP6547647.1 hypothetical protein [Candidatus Woesearchaeota archaeon]|tara:strand:- start:2386 stop:2745 length:360 start_codon:yes stop_codon:yes gene_type:complete